jgi:hypothetical protein
MMVTLMMTTLIQQAEVRIGDNLGTILDQYLLGQRRAQRTDPLRRGEYFRQ